ncbi:glycosyltransferase family A protein [Ichthyenterobacterium sp. W332]|uniref:Glycosyltransferase family A protein n=1 Tax=Microcosmobacter mediterraneus TaxID=3075607 RepID=A0ABU2YGQ7_9FLAO|nr:glycosyltransferase family A protein [Ichthyenterobacterium sp. W332]MDT0557362.1 glycosyltransferase family A protein [Ichthyenterobacterium sp. W332]
MPFFFLRYLQPTHYFQRFTNDGKSIFPIIDALPNSVKEKLEIDNNYKSQHAVDYDLSWQAINKGYIGDVLTYEKFNPIPIEDNYRFIRRNFHSAWVFYVLILRLCSFKNPIKEIRAWFISRNTKRLNFSKTSFFDSEYYSFNSKLIEDSPKVSVIIPTLNRYIYLKDVLKDLEQQDYKNFEVIVVDQSEPFNEDFYKAFNLDFNIIKQQEKALWLARNTAIKIANGDLIALSEDDVRVQSSWLRHHLKCLDFFNAQVSAGVFYPQGKAIPKERSFFALASQFATGNAMLYKDVFSKIGLFDRQFEKQRMGDGEFGMRVYLNDIKSVSNPLASCIDVKANTGGLREMGSWDAFRPSNFFAPRPIPSVLYFFRRYFGKKASILAMLRTVPISVFPYQFKKNKPLLVFGSFITLLLFPIIFCQVMISWQRATKKINKGTIIEILD